MSPTPVGGPADGCIVALELSVVIVVVNNGGDGRAAPGTPTEVVDENIVAVHEVHDEGSLLVLVAGLLGLGEAIEDAIADVVE